MAIGNIVMIVLVILITIILMRWVAGFIKGLLSILAFAFVCYLIYDGVGSTLLGLGQSASGDLDRLVESSWSLRSLGYWAKSSWYDFKIWSGL